LLLSYLLLVLSGLVLTVRLAQQRSRHWFTASGGTVLAMLAIPTGFSIGMYVAATAALLLIFAGTRPRQATPSAGFPSSSSRAERHV
jgi:hypothetical protein